MMLKYQELLKQNQDDIDTDVAADSGAASRDATVKTVVKAGEAAAASV